MLLEMEKGVYRLLAQTMDLSLVCVYIVYSAIGITCVFVYFFTAII